SPLVENATAPVPWKAGRWWVGRVVWEVSGRSSIPSDLIGIECTNAPVEASTASRGTRCGRRRGVPNASLATTLVNHLPNGWRSLRNAWTSDCRRPLDGSRGAMCRAADRRVRRGEPTGPGSPVAEPTPACPGAGWRDRGPVARPPLDPSPESGGRALVHRRRRRMADHLRILDAHGAR